MAMQLGSVMLGNFHKAAVFAVFCVSTAACGMSDRSERYTLYRNSSMMDDARIHWASFDVDNSGSYNEENCQMAADLLNKNVKALNPEGTNVRFWCEAGAARNLSK